MWNYIFICVALAEGEYVQQFHSFLKTKVQWNISA